MNITPQFNYLPLATAVNPPTDNLRRENHMRDVIAQPAALSQSAAEKGVASEKDKARTPVQDNEFIDFVSLQEQQEQDENTVGDSTQNRNQSSEQSSDQETEQNQEQAQEADASGEPGQEAQPDAEQLAEQQEIQALKSRDQEVRAHELAHASVGGSTTGSPTYTYQQGPDGRKYAVGGEVSVDLSPVSGDPQATIAKMQKVHAAALAPAEPSGQDKQVAATASRIILQAQSELAGADPAESNRFSTPASMDNENAGSAENDSTVEDGQAVAATNGSLSASGEASDFDTLINKTLAAQEEVVPTRSPEVDARASRVENFYLKINQAYEKPVSHNFQLTA
ncbi:putative metalloprotease CJM1_0395 family protein [Thalassomonas actiniarum]|uniref:Catalase n=1 Tax=Thalassomonas actiniarum TaxID=485447 RepID=A0AAE9YQD5_9GAMM|nr:putative metalloprotease CJM1_0395 family protein [Thalassomonas actiniarum]WDD98911.1 hypothetical protein SG35_027410 [Thalassomonas actiniarum]